MKNNLIKKVGIVLVGIVLFVGLYAYVTPSFEEIYTPLDSTTVDFLAAQTYNVLLPVSELENWVGEAVETQMYDRVDTAVLEHRWFEVTLEKLDVQSLTNKDYNYLEETMVELSHQIDDILGYATVVLDSDGELVMYIADGYIYESSR